MAEGGAAMLTIVLVIPLLILIALIVAVPIYFFIIRKNREIRRLQGHVDQLQGQNEKAPR